MGIRSAHGGLCPAAQGLGTGLSPLPGNVRPRLAPASLLASPRDRFPPLSAAVASALATFGRELRRRHGAELIELRLFGSFARGEAGEDSDVDVAVVLERAGWETRRAVIDLAADVGLAHDLTLSPTVFDRETFERWRHEERPLVRDIEAEGVPL